MSNRQAIINAKESIINEINNFIITKDWNTSSQRMKNIDNEFNSCGFLDGEDGKKLYSRFIKAKNDYRSKSYEHFKNLSKIQKEAKCNCIKELRNILNDILPMYKHTEKVNSIRAEWKTLGNSYTHKNENEEFHKLLSEYYDRRAIEKTIFDDQLAKKKENAAEKDLIIKKMTKIVRNCGDNPYKYYDEIKELKDTFYSIGFAPNKIQNQDIQDRFNTVNSQYYEIVSDYKRNQKLLKASKKREQISKKEEYIHKLNDAIDDLYSKIQNLDVDSKYYTENRDRYYGYIDDKKSKIYEVEREIYDLKIEAHDLEHN